LKDMGRALLCFPPSPASHRSRRRSDMPNSVLDHASRPCAARIGHYMRIPEARGVLVNTYEWLEARAVRASGRAPASQTARRRPCCRCTASER
jgi:hypothetical protein